ncbi:MAG: hypothetical protein Phog2KO_24970 [Phototrophicaceae bacterium]
MKGFSVATFSLLIFLFACTPTIEPTVADVAMRNYYCDNSPFNQTIPAGTEYQFQTEIQTFRQNKAEWSAPIYRVDENLNPPLVSIANDYSSRVENWSIPINAIPATADDHHLIVVVPADNMVYEMWDARWIDTSTMEAGGMMNFPINGLGISDPPNQRVTAAGFSVLAGMLTREDFINPDTGFYDPNMTIDHALSMSLAFDIVGTDTFVAPAIGGESQGLAGPNGIPMGARFAIGSNMPDDALNNVHPLSRAMLIAARDYGIYVNDTNSAQQIDGGYVGNVRVEVGLTEILFNRTADTLINRVQRDIANIIDQYGLYRLNYPNPEPVPCN